MKMPTGGFAVLGTMIAVLPAGLLALSVTASGQTAAPSPIAPGDTSRPIFDTNTPTYDTIAGRGGADTMVAELDGVAITLGQVGDAIRALPPTLASRPFEVLYPMVLSRLIHEKAVVLRARQANVDDEPDVKRRMKDAADHVLATEFLQREVRRQITEIGLQQRYQKEVASVPGPEEVLLRAIAVKTEPEGRKLIDELRAGADFAELARRSSVDPSTAQSGGDLGYNTRDMLNPEIAAVAFALAPGHIQDFPVASGEHWMVLRVVDRRRRATKTFAEAREDLLQAAIAEAVPRLGEKAREGLKVRAFDIMGRELKSDGEESR